LGVGDTTVDTAAVRAVEEAGRAEETVAVPP
jgi:hypothetical protein